MNNLNIVWTAVGTLVLGFATIVMKLSVTFLHNYLLQGVQPKRRVYKMVLTGGPCGGKTTGQVTPASFLVTQSVSILLKH